MKFLTLFLLVLGNVFADDYKHVCADLSKYGVTQDRVNYCKENLLKEKQLKDAKKKVIKSENKIKEYRELIKRFEKVNCDKITTMSIARKQMPLKLCSTQKDIEKYGFENVSVCCSEVKKQNIDLATRKIENLKKGEAPLMLTITAISGLQEGVKDLVSGRCSELKCISEAKSFFQKLDSSQVSPAENFINNLFLQLREDDGYKGHVSVKQVDLRFQDTVKEHLITYCNDLARGLDLSNKKTCRKYIDSFNEKLQVNAINKFGKVAYNKYFENFKSNALKECGDVESKKAEEVSTSENGKANAAEIAQLFRTEVIAAEVQIGIAELDFDRYRKSKTRKQKEKIRMSLTSSLTNMLSDQKKLEDKLKLFKTKEAKDLIEKDIERVKELIGEFKEAAKELGLRITDNKVTE